MKLSNIREDSPDFIANHFGSEQSFQVPPEVDVSAVMKIAGAINDRYYKPHIDLGKLPGSGMCGHVSRVLLDALRRAGIACEMIVGLQRLRPAPGKELTAGSNHTAVLLDNGYVVDLTASQFNDHRIVYPFKEWLADWKMTEWWVDERYTIDDRGYTRPHSLDIETIRLNAPNRRPEHDTKASNFLQKHGQTSPAT